MTVKQFNEITEWQKVTFPQATPISKLHHLEQEVAELMTEINDGQTGYISETQDNKIKLEFADCFLLIFGAAAAYGMTFADICQAIDDKFTINKNRTWGKPDANGVVNHI